MILYALTFLASVLIGLLFYRIEFKVTIQALLSSYKKYGALMVQSNGDPSTGNDLLMQEVLMQFRMLGLLLFKFFLLLSPVFSLTGLMYILDIPIEELLGTVPLIISTIAFLLVYIIKKYAGRPAQ